MSHEDTDCKAKDDGRRPGNATGFIIGVDSAEKTSAELKKRGVTITEDVTKYSFGTAVSWADPDGNEFMMVEFPKEG